MEHANKINGYKVYSNKTFEFSCKQHKCTLPTEQYTIYSNIHHCNMSRSNDSFYRNKKKKIETIFAL